MILGMNQQFASPEEALAHFGVKGMRWGVRKAQYIQYRDKVHQSSPGPIKTKVVTKNGDVLTIEKEKPNPIYLAISRIQKRPLENNLSAMVIRDKSGKKVGSFQIWRESKTSVRGEWLEIKGSEQGKGYSLAAIKGLQAAAKADKDLKEVRLQVPSSAAAAKHIYTKSGFTKEKDLGFVPGYGNLEDWVYRIE